MTTDKDNSFTRLQRMRVAAGGILAVMAALYVFSRSYDELWPWLEWLRAFAEAGMVGGLADWFAVTAIFRHPLGLPIPHTAVIPREKDRIGNSLAQFVRGNFLTADRICKQVKDLGVIELVGRWMSDSGHSNNLARQALRTLPTALDALEKHDAHSLITGKLIDQLRTLEPNEICQKLLKWLLAEYRYRQLLAPLLAQLASALGSNKDKIEAASAYKAPLGRIPLLGRITRAIAQDISYHAANNIEQKLIAASESPADPLWDIIHEQIARVHNQLSTNKDLIYQLVSIRDHWLDDTNSTELASRLWLQIRQSLEKDLSRESPHSVEYLATAIIATGTAIEQNPELSNNIEKVLLEGIQQILDKHGGHLETMIRQTIEEWDADTLMKKLEHQVGPDLQYIRINGTLIGGLVGIVLHAIGKMIW